MNRILITLALALTGAALAAGNAYTPQIDDQPVLYYQASGDHASEDVVYLTMGVTDGHLVVHVSKDATPGALPLTFDAIPKPSTDRFSDLYGAPGNGEWLAQVDARAAEADRVEELAGMQSLRDGWSVLHRDTSVQDAIAAYSAWFTGAGLTVTADAAHTIQDVQPFVVSGLSSPLRVVFHRQGAGVRVYIGRN